MSLPRKRAPKSKADQPIRRRRSAQQARRETLAVARDILLSRGPDAVTLKNVAAELGTTHTNLLHHFGTANALQAALMNAMMRDLADAIDGAVARMRDEPEAGQALVDSIFDAFDKGGAGDLTAWMALSGNLDKFDQLREPIRNLTRFLEEKGGRCENGKAHSAKSTVSALMLMALGDALAGSALKRLLEHERGAVRGIATQLFPAFL